MSEMFFWDTVYIPVKIFFITIVHRTRQAYIYITLAFVNL